ncbi:MAG: ATP-binding protein, partial [Thermomicrobiales bacterium]
MSPQFATDSRSSIAVTALSVERMDGLTPRYDIDTLCAGVNIVYGPNSSGKSRTAEAIQALFWPSESKLKAQLRGVLTAQSDLWNIAYNDGQASHRRNGVPEGATNLSQVPSAHRDRYLLTLHDMLSDDNGNLAEEIQRASAGGYDLKAARASMKLMDLPPKPSGTTYNKAYRDAKNATSEIRTELGRLQSSEESLSLLRQKLDAAIAAGRRQLELTAALDHARAKERLADHVLRQAQFHPLMRSMDGAESKTATTLRDNLVLLSQELGKFTSDQREAQREWDEAGFPGELPELETLHAIALRLDTLRKHTADLRSKKQEIAGRKSKRDAAQANFSGAIDDSRIADFNVDGIRKVVESQRAVENARADVSAKDQLDKWTGNLQEHDIGPLRNGVDLLSERIGVPGQEYALPPHGWIRAALISSGIAIVVEALLLSSLHSRGYAVLTLLAIPAIIAAFRSFEPATAGRAKKVEDDYRSLQLDMPAGWTRDEILPVLTELRIELARKEVDNQKSKRWGGLQTERDEATSRLRTAEADFETLNREFGLPASADHRSLDLLATSLSQWRQASDELTVAEAAGSSIALEIQDVLAVANDGLGVFGIASVDDEEGATANFRQLENRVVVARSAQETARTAQWVIEDKTKQIATQQETLANIFSKLELAVGDFRTLEEWCERQPQCRDAQKALDTAEQHVAFTRGRLFDGGDLEMASLESLENELTQPATSAATHQGLQDEITKIQTLVDSAKRESRLETAIHEERKALEDLQSARQTDYEKAVGWQAMEFVRTRTRDVNRPTVFNAAIEHFTHFTAGAYRLEMSEGSTPLFQAVNTSSNARLGLDELSSGTRVQLLIAVRLAFIETIEQRAQLPLLMDETLANSDDMRANAIIDATIEI